MKKLKKKTMLRADKMKKCYWTTAGVAVLCLCCATPAMAAGSDLLDIVNNLSDFIFSIIKALGVIILGWVLCRSACRSSLMTPANARRDFFASLVV